MPWKHCLITYQHSEIMKGMSSQNTKTTNGTKLRIQNRRSCMLIMLFLLIALFLLILAIISPGANERLYQQAVLTATPMPVIPGGPTPLPEEFLTNQYLTNSIVFGATVMIMIVLGGTLVVITQKETENGKK